MIVLCVKQLGEDSKFQESFTEIDETDFQVLKMVSFSCTSSKKTNSLLFGLFMCPFPVCVPRSFKRNDPVNPYHVNSGYVFAPATSANDSEISSDALTDDSMSMTDSSV